MGVDINTYTVWGIKISGYDMEFSEKYHDHEIFGYAKQGEDIVIFDGMNCDYMVLGHILFDGGNIRHGDLNETFLEQDLNELAVIEQAYRDRFIKHFPDFAHFLNKPFKILTFTHFH